ncbi:hypothetical protein [Aeromicrobium sp. Sec7.5]|uniref:hypothetical protein n=1 Tax=Aeromicrobium sp. Sec7.5 TaxID=3121276 RepID=UPI002FE46E6D
MRLRLLTVVLVATVALMGCSGAGTAEEPQEGPSGDTAEPESPEPSPEPLGIEAPAGTPVDPAQFPDAYTGHAFLTPTGNIICWIDDAADQWGCLVKERTYAEPAGAEDCLKSFGGGFSSVQGSALMPLCRGGVIAAAETGGGVVLPYGQAITVGDVTCGSEEAGVTCLDQGSGHGLFLSRAAYVVS